VGKVKNGKSTQVPLITWGADIRTIYANGNALRTKSGSIFNKLGLDIQLVRDDVFTEQVKKYLRGESPYLRGTLGMINTVSELLNRDKRTRPIVIYQLSESAGGDALVVKAGIKNAWNLKGKTVAVQAYGPHVDYLSKVLTDANLSVTDVKIRWLPDLTGTDNSPATAFANKNIDAAMVIIPDALALTSGGNVGTGAEQSVKGARILLSTKTANRVIADVYAVRADYFASHKAEVEKFVRGMMRAQNEVESLVADKASRRKAYQSSMRAAADILLDSAKAMADAEALYTDAHHINVKGNAKFFTDKHYPRRFAKRNREIQSTLMKLGLLNKSAKLDHAAWNYGKLQSGIAVGANIEAPQFNENKVASVIAKKQRQGTLQEGELFRFEVYFKPNQKAFSADLYHQAFDRVIELASTYGGAIITVEGHSDPLGYLRKKKAGSPEVVLRRIKQSAKNLSLTRANAVRDNIVSYAQKKSIVLDKSQFAVVGHGITNPRTGMCGADPCAPKTKQQWRDNMRVEFRIIQVEAEAEVFQPL